MKTNLYLYILAGILLWNTTIQAQDAQGRIADLQDSVGEISNRLQNQIQIHGFLSQGWMKSNDNNWLTNSDKGSLDFNEFGLNFMGNLTDDLQLGIQLFSRDLGDFTTKGVVIDWAYADYAYADWLGIRAGRIKTPVGMYNETRDVDAVRVPVLLPQGVYPEPLRDVSVAVNGMALYGNIGLGPVGSFDYMAYIGGNSIDPDKGVGKFFSGGGALAINDITMQESYGMGGMWETPLDGLRFNSTLNRVEELEIEGAYSVTGIIPHFDTATVGAEYGIGDFVFSGEYKTQRGELTLTVPPGIVTVTDIYIESYYTMGTYQLTDKLAFGTYYGLYYPDAGDKDGSTKVAAGKNDFEAWQKDLCLSTKYDITPNWSVKAELHFIEGVGQLLPEENTQGYEEDWRTLLFKTSYSF